MCLVMTNGFGLPAPRSPNPDGDRFGMVPDDDDDLIVGGRVKTTDEVVKDVEKKQ